MTLVHEYGPRGECKKLFGDRSDEVLLSGPAGTGKSRATLEKLNLAALRYPGMKGAIARKTAASIGGTALETFRKFVIPELVAGGQVKWYGGSAQEPPQYRYRNGSTIVIFGLDKPSKIMSMELDMAYVQEATELLEDDWEFVSTRLRNGVMPYQQVIADANPNVPYHWLKQRCDRGQCRMINTKHTDNPVLYQGGQLTPKGVDYMRKLGALTGVRKLRLEKGLWVAAEGLVYDLFDPAVHLLDRFEIPQTWARYWAVDFGFNNPFVCQFWAEDPDGRLYLYREIYMTKRLVEDHAKDILKTVISQSGPRKGQWKEPRPSRIICDHDAEGRATLEKHLDLHTSPAHKAVSEGIETTQSRFKVQKDGKPRIYILRDALVERDLSLEEAKKPYCTEQEIEGYIWPPSKNGEEKEAPVKMNDHGCDAMRYTVAERDLGRRPRYRSFTY